MNGIKEGKMYIDCQPKAIDAYQTLRIPRFVPNTDCPGILDGSHNNLNQLTTRDWSGKLPLHGAVDDPATILLVQGVTNAPPYWNGTNPPPPEGSGAAYWLAGASLTAGSNSVDIVSLLGTESNRTDLALFMPPAKPQAFQYD